MLGRVGSELGADVAECEVKTRGQALHSGCCAKRDQSNNQGILNQVLPLVAARQVMELDVELEKQNVHFVISPSGCASQRAQKPLSSKIALKDIKIESLDRGTDANIRVAGYSPGGARLMVTCARGFDDEATDGRCGQPLKRNSDRLGI